MNTPRGLLTVLACLTVSACALPDESIAPEAASIPHQDVDVLPGDIRDGTANFTGVIIYGDKGYTGLVGDRPYPNVRINDVPIGKCEKRRAMVVPLAPGTHKVSAHSENNVVHSVTLAEGEARYFRCSFLRIGGIVFPPAVLKPADAQTAYEVVNN